MVIYSKIWTIMNVVSLSLISGKSFSKLFELKQIVRQRESKQFAEMLNRLKEGNLILIKTLWNSKKGLFYQVVPTKILF